MQLLLIIMTGVLLAFLVLPKSKAHPTNTPPPTQHTRACPSTFINAYTHTTYRTVMHTTARLYKDLQQYTAHNTERSVSRQEIIDILNSASGAITCAMPRYMGDQPKLSDVDLATLEHTMERYFNCRGLTFVRADGHYDGYHVPNSYIVIGITETEMIALAQSFAQYSLLTFNQGTAKLLHLQGAYKDQFVAATSWQEVPLANDNYTIVRTTDGWFKFTFNFDFDSLSQQRNPS